MRLLLSTPLTSAADSPSRTPRLLLVRAHQGVAEREREAEPEEGQPLPGLKRRAVVVGLRAGLVDAAREERADGVRHVTQQLVGGRWRPGLVQPARLYEVTHQLDRKHRVAGRAHRHDVGDVRGDGQRVTHDRLQHAQAHALDLDVDEARAVVVFDQRAEGVRRRAGRPHGLRPEGRDDRPGP